MEISMYTNILAHVCVYVCKYACILQVSVFLAVADKNRKTLSIKV